MTLTSPPSTMRQHVTEQALWAVGMRPVGLGSSQPDWLTVAQQNAQQALGALGFPTRRDEAWRSVSLDRLSQQMFQPCPSQMAAPVLKKALESYLYPETAHARKFVVNGQSIMEDYTDKVALPQGVFMGSLSKYLADTPNPAVLEWIQAQLNAPNQDALTLLNTAQVENIQLLVLPQGLSMAQPVQLVFVSADYAGLNTVHHPRLMIYAGEQAQGTVLVQFMAMASSHSIYWTNGALDVCALEGSHMDVILTQDEAQGARHTLSTRVSQQAHSKVRMFSMQLGAHFARHQVDWTILGEGAHGALNGLTVTQASREVHHHVMLTHEVPNATSEQLFKSVLGGTSRVGFNGTIEIVEGAQNTDASQLNKNLLLSEEARAITQPQLRISADDVRCSHGATVGQLSEQELFYLQSRGISREAAVTTLTFGFAEDVIEKLPVTSVRKHLKALVHRNLDTELGVCIHRKEARK